MKRVCYPCPIKIELNSIKFYEITFSGSLDVTCGPTDMAKLIIAFLQLRRE